MAGANLASYYKSLFKEAHQLTLKWRFVEADDLCHRLLREPRLPLLYRAGCNLLLSFGIDNPVDFAKEAVKWYEKMYNEVCDDPVNGPHHLALLEQARKAVTAAEKRMAQDDNSVDDEDNEEDIDEDDKAQEEQGLQDDEGVSGERVAG